MGGTVIVLYVDDSKDDAFFFGRALKKVSSATEWRHVFDTHEAKCYLRGGRKVLAARKLSIS